MRTKEEILIESIKDTMPDHVKEVISDRHIVNVEGFRGGLVAMETYAIEYFNNHCKEVKGKRIEERENDFISNVIRDHCNTYPIEMITKFNSYWTERNPNGKKMRFEMQKVFDITKRLKTWSNNNLKFNGKQKPSNAPDINNWGKAKN